LLEPLAERTSFSQVVTGGGTSPRDVKVILAPPVYSITDYLQKIYRLASE
jgi:hypothetical protein